MFFKGTEIRKLDSQEDVAISLIPKLPFSLTLCGAKNAGKTSVILNLLLNPNILKGKFNKIYFISPTAKLDDKVHSLDEVKGVMVYNKKLLNAVYKEVKQKYPNVTKEAFMSQVDKPEIEYIDDTMEALNMFKELKEEQMKIKEKYDKTYQDKVLVIIDDFAGDRGFYRNPELLKLLLNSILFKSIFLIIS